MHFFAMTAENAEEFFNRCIQQEAVTVEDRLKIMKEFMAEKRLLECGTLDDASSKPLEEYFEKTKYKGIVFLKQRGKK